MGRHDELMQPNFFLVGAAKSGTTSFADYLDQHPQIFVCHPKEPNYFAFPAGQRPTCHGPLAADLLYQKLLRHSVTQLDAYEALFEDAGAAVVRGDASVRYLYSPDAAERLRAYAPDAQILVILRHPVDRLHSHFHMNVRLGIEPERFELALAREDERVAAGWGWDWHYVRVGKYAEQLRRFYDRFPAEQIQVLFYEEFFCDPRRALRAVFGHLGVTDTFRPVSLAPANRGTTPRSRALRRIVWEENLVKTVARSLVPSSLRRRASDWIDRHNQQPVPRLEARLYRSLTPQFAADQRDLAELLGRRLPW